MKSELDQFLQKLRTALASEEDGAVAQAIEGVHAADVAEVFPLLEEEEQSRLFYGLPARTAAEVVIELDEGERADVVEDLSSTALTEIISELQPDDAADVLGELTEAQREDVLEQISEEQADKIEDLLDYPENSAGGIMTPELVALPRTATVAEAVDKVRAASEDEDIHYVYVVEDDGRLHGLVPLRRLVTTRRADTPLERIVDRDMATVYADDDQEVAAHKIRKYDVSAIPVIDRQERLVGRITHDDVLDVADEEADEDMFYMAGTTPSELGDMSTFQAAFVRLRWLSACMVGTAISGLIVATFKLRFPIEVYVALVAFVPMMGAMGGNSGIQISTIIIRGLATGDIAATKASKSFAREFPIALVMAPACGILAAIITIIGVPLLVRYNVFQPVLTVWEFALAVGLGMTTAMTGASLLGMSLPHLFRRIGVDPAIASGPIVTTANDIISVTAYFLVAIAVVHG